ncbi:hypothetical protein Vadar_021824 [Vaccinium darrowii]|nr:hypothetical protein Vadar_021824 [Vaccinium darrowii]
MDIDILVKIFQSFDIFELTSGIAQVCSTWRLAACDPLLWKTLDLSMLKSNFIKIPLEPYVYVDGRSDKTLTKVLKIALNLSKGNIQKLILHYNLYVSDDQLTYAAERCPRLKRLVMPAWNRIKKTGICSAIRMWADLESLTMPSIANPPYLMQEISRSSPPPPAPKKALKEIDEYILEKASRLREFFTCMDNSCIMCQRARNDEGLMRWYKYEEGLWKTDEVRSLAL